MFLCSEKNINTFLSQMRSVCVLIFQRVLCCSRKHTQNNKKARVGVTQRKNGFSRVITLQINFSFETRASIYNFQGLHFAK